MSIVTKTGDAGETGLFGGARVSKDSVRIEAVGTVDELNASLGLVLAEQEIPKDIALSLQRVQHLLFQAGADLATPLSKGLSVPRITPQHIQLLDEQVAVYEKRLLALQWFILPSGSRVGAHLHLARTICRRAERTVVHLKKSEPEETNSNAIAFLNRFGDLLFLLARAANTEAQREEIRVEYEK